MPIILPFRFLPTIKRQEFNYEFADFSSFRNLFSADEVAKIRALWSDEAAANAKVNLVGKDIDRDDLRKSKVMFIKPQANEWIYDKLSTACIQTNTNRYKFDIIGFQTELQIASYTDKGFFDWHQDFGPGDVSNRKLSITVQLSNPDEYEGGELQFMINQNVFTAPKDLGTAIVFPSFDLHRVTPITAGCRMSIVGWIGGPPYR